MSRFKVKRKLTPTEAWHRAFARARPGLSRDELASLYAVCSVFEIRCVGVEVDISEKTKNIANAAIDKIVLAAMPQERAALNWKLPEVKSG